jgi:hypothetical protein
MRIWRLAIGTIRDAPSSVSLSAWFAIDSMPGTDRTRRVKMSMAMYRPSMTYGMNTIVAAYYSVQILIRAWFEQAIFALAGESPNDQQQLASSEQRLLLPYLSNALK